MTTLTVKQFKTMLRDRLAAAGSYRKLAAQLGVNHSHLCEVINQSAREPDPAIVTACGYRKVQAAPRYEEVA